MWVIEESRNEIEGKFLISFLYLMKTGYHYNTLYPQIFTRNTLFYEYYTIFMREQFLKIWSYDIWSGSINQVPIINMIHISHIEFSEFFDWIYFFLCKNDKSMKSCKSLFMVLWRKELFYILKGCGWEKTGNNFSRIWNTYSEKCISFPVFSRSCFKKS